MLSYIVFNKKYKSKFANYTFYPDIKYKLKGEDDYYYYTIKRVRLAKSLNNKLYSINYIQKVY